MNVADSSRLSRALESLGLSAALDASQADLIILNTCVVRQSAEDRALGRLNSLRPLKATNPNLIIGLMGCLIGIHGNNALEKRFPWVDVFAAPSDPEPFLRFLEDRLQQDGSEAWRRQVDELALGKKVSLTSSHAVISIGKQLIGHLDDFALRVDELAHSGATRS